MAKATTGTKINSQHFKNTERIMRISASGHYSQQGYGCDPKGYLKIFFEYYSQE